MEELAILSFIIRFSFIVSALNCIYWVFKLGIWLRGKMQDDELLYSFKKHQEALRGKDKK